MADNTNTTKAKSTRKAKEDRESRFIEPMEHANAVSVLKDLLAQNKALSIMLRKQTKRGNCYYRFYAVKDGLIHDVTQAVSSVIKFQQTAMGMMLPTDNDAFLEAAVTAVSQQVFGKPDAIKTNTIEF